MNGYTHPVPFTRSIAVKPVPLAVRSGGFCRWQISSWIRRPTFLLGRKQNVLYFTTELLRMCVFTLRAGPTSAFNIPSCLMYWTYLCAVYIGLCCSCLFVLLRRVWLEGQDSGIGCLNVCIHLCWCWQAFQRGSRDQMYANIPGRQSASLIRAGPWGSVLLRGIDG